MDDGGWTVNPYPLFSTILDRPSSILYDFLVAVHVPFGPPESSMIPVILVTDSMAPV